MVCIVLCVPRELLSWALPREVGTVHIHGPPGSSACGVLRPYSTACLWSAGPGASDLGALCPSSPSAPHCPRICWRGLGSPVGSRGGPVMVIPMFRDPEGWPLLTPGHAILGPWISVGITSLSGCCRPLWEPGWGVQMTSRGSDRRPSPGEGWGTKPEPVSPAVSFTAPSVQASAASRVHLAGGPIGDSPRGQAQPWWPLAGSPHLPLQQDFKKGQ